MGDGAAMSWYGVALALFAAAHVLVASWVARRCRINEAVALTAVVLGWVVVAIVLIGNDVDALRDRTETPFDCRLTGKDEVHCELSGGGK